MRVKNEKKKIKPAETRFEKNNLFVNKNVNEIKQISVIKTAAAKNNKRTFIELSI
jgi:hypothetical protein